MKLQDVPFIESERFPPNAPYRDVIAAVGFLVHLLCGLAYIAYWAYYTEPGIRRKITASVMGDSIHGLSFVEMCWTFCIAISATPVAIFTVLYFLVRHIFASVYVVLAVLTVTSIILVIIQVPFAVLLFFGMVGSLIYFWVFHKRIHTALLFIQVGARILQRTPGVRRLALFTISMVCVIVFYAVALFTAFTAHKSSVVGEETVLLPKMGQLFSGAVNYSSGSTLLHVLTSSTSCTVALVFILGSVNWSMRVFSNVSFVAISGVVVRWYYRFTADPEPLHASFRQATTVSFGSVCLGSLGQVVVTLFQPFLNIGCLANSLSYFQGIVSTSTAASLSHVAIYAEPFYESMLQLHTVTRTGENATEFRIAQQTVCAINTITSITIVGFQYAIVVLALVLPREFSVDMLYHNSPCVYESILFAIVANHLFIHPIVWSSHSILYCLMQHPQQFRVAHPLVLRVVLAKAEKWGLSDHPVFAAVADESWEPLQSPARSSLLSSRLSARSGSSFHATVMPSKLHVQQNHYSHIEA